MQPSGTTKYAFRIRTRSGMLVERLAIHGRDEAEATRKLERMYPHCRVLECVPPAPPAGAPAPSFEDVVALLAK
ncbi:MAG: hypothetical protein N2544_00730 [Burkholderiales bacterium]|nr:hypothetical protein [Burkholderiales bacterium]